MRTEIKNLISRGEFVVLVEHSLEDLIFHKYFPKLPFWGTRFSYLGGKYSAYTVYEGGRHSILTAHTSVEFFSLLNKAIEDRERKIENKDYCFIVLSS